MTVTVNRQYSHKRHHISPPEFALRVGQIIEAIEISTFGKIGRFNEIFESRVENTVYEDVFFHLRRFHALLGHRLVHLATLCGDQPVYHDFTTTPLFLEMEEFNGQNIRKALEAIYRTTLLISHEARFLSRHVYGHRVTQDVHIVMGLEEIADLAALRRGIVFLTEAVKKYLAFLLPPAA